MCSVRYIAFRFNWTIIRTTKRDISDVIVGLQSLIYFHICIYVSLFLLVCVCVHARERARACTLCFIQHGFEFFYECFSFIWSNVQSLIWYTVIILNFSLLHSYWCLDKFDFLFSGILRLLLWSDILVLRACAEPMSTSLHFLYSIMQTTFFELQLKSLFILNFVFRFLKE